MVIDHGRLHPHGTHCRCYSTFKKSFEYVTAIIGARLFGFKRNTTVFCGVRKYHLTAGKYYPLTSPSLRQNSLWCCCWLPIYAGKRDIIFSVLHLGEAPGHVSYFARGQSPF